MLFLHSQKNSLLYVDFLVRKFQDWDRTLQMEQE